MEKLNKCTNGSMDRWKSINAQIDRETNGKGLIHK